MTDVDQSWDELEAQLQPAEEQPPENFYPDVESFVAGFLAPTFAHEVNDQVTTWRWCAVWNRHTEAVARLEALWQAWEVLRLQPGTGPATWLRDYADPTMAALTSPQGTFARCSTTVHQSPPPLPTPAPSS